MNYKKKLNILLTTIALTTSFTSYLEAYSKENIVINKIISESTELELQDFSEYLTYRINSKLSLIENVNVIEEKNGTNLEDKKTIKGFLSKIGDFIYLNVFVVDSKNGEIVLSLSEKGKNKEELLNSSDKLLDKIIQKLSTSTIKDTEKIVVDPKIIYPSNSDIDNKIKNKKEETLITQEEVSNSEPISNISLVGGMGFTNKGITFPSLTLHYRTNNNIFSGRFTHNAEFALFTSPGENVWDLGLLYGKAYIGQYGYLYGGAGISFVGALKRTTRIPDPPGTGFNLGSKYNSEIYSAIGIPLQVEAMWTPISNFGIGFQGIANLNLAVSFIGINLVLRAGKM